MVNPLHTALLIIIICLIAALQLNCLLFYINNMMYHTKRARIYQFANLSSLSISRRRRRRERQQRQFWIRPGRTSAWWDNFVNGIVVEEEWKENFRMSKPTFTKLCDDLRPLIQKQQTSNALTSQCRKTSCRDALLPL